MSTPYATPQRAGHAPASSSQQSFAPRSSSIPFSMGHSQSKPVPPLPSSSPATKGFNAAVAGGIKLKRAFAGRRKKSEDASSAFLKNKEQVSKPPVPPRIESSVSAPPQYRSTVVSPASLPPPPPKKEPPPLELVPGGSRNSVMAISPGISSAVNYISLMDQQKQEPDKDKEKDKENSKENWRKSDSTNSHHTIRPGGGAAKSSRPVSWAESFQSTHTVVQTSNRRLSALIGDADFGMPEAEEDDDDDDRSDSPSHPQHRRATSQGMPASTQPFPLPPSPPPSAPATNLKYPSHSISEGFSIHPMNHRPPPLTTPSSSQPPPQNLRGKPLYISPPVSTTASQQERLQQPQPPLPHHHPSSTYYSSSPPISSTSSASASFRQTAISMTSGGLGPAAAGLAKRAVEKMSMGKKWAMGMGMGSSSSAASGSGYSSSASGSSSHTGSTGGGPSSLTSAYTDYGLVGGSKESMAGGGGVHKHHHHHLHGMGHRRTPGPGSGATSTSAAGSISSSSITSSSDASSSDPFAQSSGPMLGWKLRGGLLSKNGVKVGGGGVVFGRSLALGVRETGVSVGKAPGAHVEEHAKEGLVRELEERMLPAVVVRCAQHILLWGIQEEGLFRVSGRPTHVSKLRAEFDSGADYDMTESTPGDLDPHAVASVFKAYLRELPEPILSHKLSPLFDAAVNKETTINADALFSGGHGGGMRLGARPGLPTSGPKSGFAIRKPPSLSTLAMPTFTAIPPPSSALISSIRTLISQLPQENRDLLRTVVELIRATAGRSKETKMPLSNLLLVFCPSLSMTPPLLKVLCEAEGIWGGMYGEEEEGGLESEKEEVVIDIRRQTMPARSPVANDGGGFFADEPAAVTAKAAMMRSTMKEEEESESVRAGRASLDTTDNNPSSDYHASAEESIYDDEYEMLGEVAPRRRIQREGNGFVERREEVPTVYLDCSSSSASSLGCQEDLSGSVLSEVLMPYMHHSREAARDDDGSISSGNYSMHAPSPPPLLSSSSDSVATPISSGNPSFSHLPLEHEQQHHEKEEQDDQLSQLHTHDHSHSQHQRHEGNGPEIAEVTPLELRSPTSQMQTSKRPVISNPIPIPVQFPTSPQPPSTPQKSGGTPTALKRRSIPMLSLPNFSSTQPPAAKKDKDSSSPTGSPSGLGLGMENLKSLHRSKKPSLKLLFSKRSASSLTSGGGERDRSNSVGSGMPFISAPIPQAHASMVSLSPQWSPKLPQHSHHSTPPRSVSDSYANSNSGSGSGSGSSSVSTPVSAVTAPQSERAGSLRSLPPVLDTPIEGASFGFDLGFGLTTPRNVSTITSTSTADASLNNSSSQQIGNTTPLELPVTRPLAITHRKTATTTTMNYIRPQASTSNLSILSTTSSNHLSLFEDEEDEEEMEDWTQSVLSAADVDVGVQKAP